MIIRYEKIFVKETKPQCQRYILIRDYIFVQYNNKIKLQANIERVCVTQREI